MAGALLVRNADSSSVKHSVFADSDTPTPQALVPPAPRHPPHDLAAIGEVSEMAPHLPRVACCDRAFHRSQAAVARAFALRG
jgi:acetate kinase